MAVQGPIATVTIGATGKRGVTITGHRYGAHPWRSTLGLTPVLVEWRMPVGDAAVVLAESEVEITITPAMGMGGPQTWKRIVVVGEGPSDDPEVRVVLISDVRWYLLYVNLISTYNRRIYSGNKFLTAGGFDHAVALTSDQITYALPTLRNDGTNSPPAWTAKQLIDDVCARLQKLVGESGISGGVVFNDLSNLSTRGTWNPSDVMLDASGNVALGQALGTVGGVDVRPEPDGTLSIVNAQLGAERATIEAFCTYSLASGAGPGATPKGVMRLCAMNHVAPRSFLVQYNRELEVRGDGWEQATEPATAAAWYSSDAPWVEPVIRVADLSLFTVIDGLTPSSYTAVQGSVVPVDPWCAGVAHKADAVNAPPGFAAITRPIIQQNYLSDVLNKLYSDSAVDPLGPSAIWSSRIGQIMSDYRNLFRLNPRFARRCVPGTIIAKRAALLNQQTGERQPSPVIRDYYTKPTTRGLLNQQRFGNQVTCVPHLGGQTFPPSGRTYEDPSFPDQVFPFESGQFAPFSLTVEDGVNGYFRLAPKLLPGQEVSQLIPGLLTQGPGIDTFDIEKDSEIPWFEYCSLIATDRVCFIFSAVPVGPNGEAQVQTYEVDAQTALSRLGVNASAVTAQAPKRTIRVGPGVQSARIAWDDNHRKEILACFTAGAGGDPNALVPVNDQALLDYAVSCAAAWMATVLDHYEGTSQIAFSPAVNCVGSLTVVEHTVTSTGELYTTLHATHVTPALRPESFMSQSTRNVIFGNLGGSLPS